MPANKQGNRMRGRVVQWPWSDRGRSAVTRESVQADIVRLAALLPASMRPVGYSERPSVVVQSLGWA
jgi:hypothetical protein